MEYKELKVYLKKLYEEKSKIEETMNYMQKDGVLKTREEMASELSFYDNHPADTGGSLYNIEKDSALLDNEKEILNKINEAIINVENGTYGKCEYCGNKISKERLDFIPYASRCIDCENEISNLKTFNSNDRVIEEKSFSKPFGFGYNDLNEYQTGFDAEDSYQSVERFNKLDDLDEYYEDDEEYVEEVEKISNQQYKQTLS